MFRHLFSGVPEQREDKSDLDDVNRLTTQT
jgi:hypothetical protein